MACWLARLRVKSPLAKLRVMKMRIGSVTKDARVSSPEMRAMTCRALANAKTTFTMFKMPKPKSIRTWTRSFVERLMISPADIVR